MTNSPADRLRHILRRLRPNVEEPGPRRLELTNRLGLRRVGGGPGPVVSLTSYGERIGTSHLAMESIARGTLTPGQVILWLDDQSVFEDLPRPLRRLRRRGLQIRLSENFGPHTKYYPYVEASSALTEPLVTADDDTIYPRTWLEGLVRAHRESPDCVIVYRARTVEFLSDGALAPYATWGFSSGTEPTFRHFLTAVSGALHPPRLLAALRARGRSFEAVCPRADDVWLHHTAVREGVPVRLVTESSVTFPLIDGSQETALWYSNLTDGGNDTQIAATFTADDVAVLRASSTPTSHSERH